METPTQINTEPSSGLFGFISKAAKSVSVMANTVTQAIKGDQQPVQSPSNTGYTGYGGAKSRRRKCNKKHRHTKSCRKNVKKGRKTQKH